MIGYGAEPPHAQWLAAQLQFVINYEEAPRTRSFTAIRRCFLSEWAGRNRLGMRNMNMESLYEYAPRRFLASIAPSPRAACRSRCMAS
jgi:hypothetical protein